MHVITTVKPEVAEAKTKLTPLNMSELMLGRGPKPKVKGAFGGGRPGKRFAVKRV